MDNIDQPVLEEARIIVARPELCATITSFFTDAGIAAYGDYRDEDDRVLIRDAFADGVDYVVFANIWQVLATPNLRRKTNRDLLVKVYTRREQGVKTMKVGAAVQMILERRHI